MNYLADALDAALRTRLPDKFFSGMLSGREPEIRQDALLLIVQTLLGGNTRLIDATRTNDGEEIRNQLQRTISAALKICRARFWRALNTEAARFQEVDPSNGLSLGTCDHPSRRTLWALPPDAQRQLVLAALRQGVEQQLVSRQNAELLKSIVVDGLSQAEVAKSLRVSRSAVQQRVGSVRERLRAILENSELPLE